MLAFCVFGARRKGNASWGSNLTTPLTSMQEPPSTKPDKPRKPSANFGGRLQVGSRGPQMSGNTEFLELPGAEWRVGRLSVGVIQFSCTVSFLCFASCMYTYMYIYQKIRMCVCVCMYVCMYVCTYVHLYTYMHRYLNKYIQGYRFIYTHIYTDRYVHIDRAMHVTALKCSLLLPPHYHELFRIKKKDFACA